jgi:iron(III)-enterobactin esterase
VPKGDVFEFTMESKDSKIYPGFAREPNTFAVPDPADPNKVIVNSYPAPYTRRVAVYVPKQASSQASEISAFSPSCGRGDVVRIEV